MEWMLSAGILFVVLVAVLGFGGQILGQVESTQLNVSTFRVTNQSVAVVDDTAVSLRVGSNMSGASGTGNYPCIKTLVSAGNATFDVLASEDGDTALTTDCYSITCTGDLAGGCGGIIQVSYDYVASKNAYNITSKGSSGLFKMGTWLPTIAIIVSAVVVIGILMLLFTFRGNQNASGI